MKNLNKKIEMEKEFEYLFFTRAYLMLAYLGSEEILNKIRTEKYNNPLGEMVPDWMYENNYLLAPVIFNFKHAMEIFLKTIPQFLFIEPDKKSHDLKYLFQKIEKKLNDKKNTENLKRLIVKYHHNNFLKNKIKENFIIEDRSNDVFRYPDNKANVSLNFFYIFNRFDEKDLIELQKDIKNFDKFSYKIGAGILTKEFGPIPNNSKMKIGANILKSKLQ